MLADPQPTTREAPASAADMSDPRGDPSTGVADPAPRDAHPVADEIAAANARADAEAKTRRLIADADAAARSLIPDGAFDADPLDVLDALAAARRRPARRAPRPRALPPRVRVPDDRPATRRRRGAISLRGHRPRRNVPVARVFHVAG